MIAVKPSLAPKEDEESLISIALITKISIAVIFAALTLYITAMYLQILWITYAGAMLLFFAAGFCSLLLLSPLAQIVAQSIGRYSVPIFFAARSLAAEPFRFGLSAFAFGCGFSFLMSLHIFIDSFRGTLESWMQNTFQGDIYIRDDAGAMSEPVRKAVADSNNTKWSVETREIDTPFSDARVKIFLVPLSLVLNEKLYDVEDTADNTIPSLLMSEVASRRYHLTIGQSIYLLGANRHIDGIYRDFANERGAFLIDFAEYQKSYPSAAATIPIKTMTAKFNSVSGYERIKIQLESLKIPTLITFKTSTLKDEALRIFDDTFRITTYIQLLIFIVCVINFSLVLLHDIEVRTRQYGTLRLLGFSKADFSVAIITLAFLILLASGISAELFGRLLGLSVTNQINPLSFGWSINQVVSTGAVLLPVLFGAAAIIIIAPLLVRPVQTRIKNARVTLE